VWCFHRARNEFGHQELHRVHPSPEQHTATTVISETIKNLTPRPLTSTVETF